MLTNRATNVSPSLTLAITAKAKQMIKDGMDVKLFGAGEPDFDTPENVKQAGISAIEKGHTKYTPANGMPELKQGLCEKFKKENDLDYSLSEVMVSNGGKQIIYLLMQALLQRGDEVLIPVPYWVSYPEQVKLASATPVYTETDDFIVRADILSESITGKTKMLIINSPSNPSGAVIPKKELKKIADIAIENNIHVLSDEVYEHFVYSDEPHCSIASIDEEIKKLTITANAVSKTYSMTGWRLGYCAGNEQIIKAMSSIQDHLSSNPCSIAQHAALEALRGDQSSVAKMRSEFMKRRNFIVERLNDIDGISCNKPDGAFYVFPDISGLFDEKIKGSLDFSDQLLQKALVAVVPGIAFGSDDNIRLSFTSSTEDMTEGLDRIKEFAEK